MRARPVVAGRTYLLSRRVTQRQHLLRPDDDVNNIYLYALAIAAHRYGIEVHGWVAMSNHHHVVFTDVKGNFPRFLGYMHRLMATCFNCLRGRWENFWAMEQASVVWLVEKHDRLDKLVYTLANPVAAGLVERAADWPGAISLIANLHGKVLRVKRPGAFFDAEGKMPEEVELEAKRLPGYERLTRDEWKDRLLEAIAKAEKAAREMLREQNRHVLGRKAVLATSPFSRPKTREPRRKLRPFIGCLDTQRRELEIDLLDAFHAAYEIAREAWTKHKLTTRFPFGTYKMVQLGAFAAKTPPRAA
jgi:REP element-mobilizing transposase RayT